MGTNNNDTRLPLISKFFSFSEKNSIKFPTGMKLDAGMQITTVLLVLLATATNRAQSEEVSDAKENRVASPLAATANQRRMNEPSSLKRLAAPASGLFRAASSPIQSGDDEYEFEPLVREASSPKKRLTHSKWRWQKQPGLFRAASSPIQSGDAEYEFEPLVREASSPKE